MVADGYHATDTGLVPESEPHLSPEAEEVAREARRRQVTMLYLAGINQTEIARQLRVGQATISRDIQRIKEEYRVARQDLIDREAASYDDMEREALLQFQQEGKDPKWFALRLQVKKQRADLLGLNAPVSQVHTGPDGGPIRIAPVWDIAKLTDEQLDQYRAIAAAAEVPPLDEGGS